MKRRIPFRIITTMTLLSLTAHSSPSAYQRVKLPAMFGADRPFIAVWCDDMGFLSEGAPYLRAAIWEGGKVVFAPDAKKWNRNLQVGFISPTEVSDIEKRIAKTGVFRLSGTYYLVPDARVYCMAVELRNEKQMLYWDEVEQSNYGINSEPTLAHSQFKRCWAQVNQIVTSVRPAHVSTLNEAFDRVPRSWYLKPCIEAK